MISSTSSGPKDAQRELATEHCSLPEAGQTQSMKRGVEKEAEKKVTALEINGNYRYSFHLSDPLYSFYLIAYRSSLSFVSSPTKIRRQRRGPARRGGRWGAPLRPEKARRAPTRAIRGSVRRAAGT